MNRTTRMPSDGNAFPEPTDFEGEPQRWTRRGAIVLGAGALLAFATPGYASSFVHRPQPRATHVVVSKRNRVLELLQGEVSLRKYRVHLGFVPDGHKAQSGDGRTPEGTYLIDRRNPRSSFHLSLGISYPNERDVALARAAGVSPGGDIFIHGGPVAPKDRGRSDWTAGCIAVTDREMEEIWSLVPTGTPITIFG